MFGTLTCGTWGCGVGEVRIDLNNDGIKALLRGPEVQAQLRRIAENVQNAAGEGHVVKVYAGSTRARAIVATDTAEAARKENQHRNLTRAISAGGV